jgi:hypothetical protein
LLTQTNGGFSGKILAWQNRGLPSQFAVLSRADNQLIGYFGFFIKKSMERMKLKSVIDCIRIIGTRAWQPKQRKPPLSRSEFVACHFIDSSRERSLAPGGRKNPDAVRAQNRFQSIPSAGFRNQPGMVGNELCRVRNSSARAR